MAPAVRSLFSSRVDSFFDANITSRDILPSICNSLYNLFHCLELWFGESIFPTDTNWKTIVKTKMFKKEANAWYLFGTHHPSVRVVSSLFGECFPRPILAHC